MNENNPTPNDKLKTLIANYMKQEQCDAALAGHCFTRVCQFLGFRDPAPLLDVLAALEAESLTVSAIGIREARYLRGLYDCAIMAVLPIARQAFLTVIENGQQVQLVEETRH